MSNEKASITRGVLWNSWGNFAFIFVNWLLTVLITRFLGYTDAGIYSLALSTIGIFNAIAAYGMRNYHVSDLGGKHSSNQYLLARVITCGASAFLLAVFLLAEDYSAKQTVCIALYMANCIFGMAQDYTASVFQLHGHMDYAGKSLLVRSVIVLATVPVVLAVTKNLFLALIALALSTPLTLCLYDLRRFRRMESLKFQIKDSGVWKLLAICLPLAVCSLLSGCISSIPRYFLERYLGAENLGIYASVASPTLVVQVAASYVFTPMITVFAESFLSGNRQKFKVMFLRCLAVVGGLAVVALPGGQLLGRWGLQLLYGSVRSNIVEYTYLLLPLIVCTILTALMWLLSSVLTVVRNFRALIIANGLATVLSIVLSILLIPRYDMQGASYAQIIALTASILVMAVWFSRDIRKIGK